MNRASQLRTYRTLRVPNYVYFPPWHWSFLCGSQQRVGRCMVGEMKILQLPKKNKRHLKKHWLLCPDPWHLCFQSIFELTTVETRHIEKKVLEPIWDAHVFYSQHAIEISQHVVSHGKPTPNAVHHEGHGLRVSQLKPEVFGGQPPQVAITTWVFFKNLGGVAPIWWQFLIVLYNSL